MPSLKNALFGADLLKPTMPSESTGSPMSIFGPSAGPVGVSALFGQGSAVGAALVVQPRDPGRERLYLRFGGRILERLEASADPLSDRDLYAAVALDQCTFEQFRVVLADTVQAGMIRVAGVDSRFGDTLFTLSK